MDNSLISRLWEAMEARDVSIAKFATDADIPADRVYKWKSKGTNPKAEDSKKIEDWITGNKSDKSPTNKNQGPKNSQEITFTKDELVNLFMKIAEAASSKVEKAMKETERILKEQNAYLQDQVNTNLRDIEKWSFASLVDLQATIRYQAKKDSGGNESKEKSILAEQSRIAIDLRKNLLKARKTSNQGKLDTQQ